MHFQTKRTLNDQQLLIHNNDMLIGVRVIYTTAKGVECITFL